MSISFSLYNDLALYKAMHFESTHLYANWIQISQKKLCKHINETISRNNFHYKNHFNFWMKIVSS